MPLIKWSPELELGLEEIDNQHKQLITMINELNIAIEYNQPNIKLLCILSKLQEYTDSHFKAEEDIFTRYNYPDRVEHEAEHAKFVDSIKYMRKQCLTIDAPMSSRIKEFLLSWLGNHIKTKDKEYKAFIQEAVSS